MQTPALPIDKPFLNTLELKLSDLAAAWREHKGTPEADDFAQQYQAILRCMVELGFRSPLDVDSELPKRLMPQEYLELFS